MRRECNQIVQRGRSGVVTYSDTAYGAANHYGGPMRYVMLVMAMILTFDLGTAQATSLDERESLRGLPGVAVVIENISPDVQAVGLTEEAVQTDVELILQSSGIRVFTIVEIANMPSKPFLYVGITLRNGSVYSYYLGVRHLTQRI